MMFGWLLRKWRKRITLLPNTIQLCKLLEDPDEVWVQDSSFFKHAPTETNIWIANGEFACEPLGSCLPAVDRECLWAAVQVARANTLARQIKRIKHDRKIDGQR